MTRDDVQRWLDRYIAAWQRYDAAEIGDLFAADAEYRYHPGDDPVRGRDAIVADWLAPGGDPDARDRPGTWDARYEPFAVDGTRAVAVGETVYHVEGDRASILKRYANVFVLEFDGDGRCRSFTEHYMKRP
jgi:ketosteroid isomerase-like protein